MTRIGTPAEWRKWQTLKRLADNIHARLDLLSAYAQNEGMAFAAWSTRYPEMPDPRPMSRMVGNMQVGFKQIREAMRRVDDGVYALQWTTDDKINIVDPKPEDMQGFIVIAAGVVIVAGLAWALYERDKSAREITRKFNALSRATDQMFCEKESPETCAEWKQWKADSGYGDQKSALDRALDSIGSAAKTGTSWGLALGIPLVLYMVSQWLSEKSR